MNVPSLPCLLAAPAGRLMSVGSIDIFIIAVYFALVLVIGFYLKRFARTGEDFFMAGRDMTAWIAGLSFISANLGSLEMMGYAATTYQYTAFSWRMLTGSEQSPRFCFSRW